MTDRDPNLIEFDVTTLRRVGIAPEFSRPLLTEGLPIWLDRASQGLATACLFLFLGSQLISLNVAEVFANRFAEDAANGAGGLAYSSNIGFAGILILFGGLTSISIVAYIPPLFAGRTRRVRLALKHLLGLNKKDRNGMVRRYKSLFEQKRGQDIEETLIRWDRRFAKWALPGIFLVLIGSLCSWFEIQSRTIVFHDRVEIRSHFPLYGERSLYWRDAERVVLGCNQTDEGGSLVFRVVFKDGHSYRMFGDTYFIDPMMDVLETIDTELSTANPTYARWSWLGRDPIHPQCLRSYAGRLGENDFARLVAFLRLTSEERQRSELRP